MENISRDLSSTITACFSLFECLIPAPALEEVVLGHRRFRLIKQIAEGGFSFVYLAHEVPSLADAEDASSRQYAIKKMLAGTAEHLEMAAREVHIMQRLRHPNLLPLLAYERRELQGGDQDGVTAFYMLFNLFPDGSLVELMARLKEEGQCLSLRDILTIFLQVCSGVRAMHQMQPPLAHRDVKPHNVLVRRRAPTLPAGQRRAPPGQPSTSSGGAAAPGAGHGRRERAADEAEPLQGSAEQQSSSGRYHAVLTDFGSAREARVAVRSRQQALAQQEDAEAHCSAPYRAPELFDMPSRFTLDERVDVWSLGCLLYFLCYGVSPFERVLSDAGGSLMLAVLNGDIFFPEPDVQPEELCGLIRLCLTTDPCARPFVGDVISRVQDLLVRCPPER